MQAPGPSALKGSLPDRKTSRKCSDFRFPGDDFRPLIRGRISTPDPRPKNGPDITFYYVGPENDSISRPESGPRIRSGFWLVNPMLAPWRPRLRELLAERQLRGIIVYCWPPASHILPRFIRLHSFSFSRPNARMPAPNRRHHRTAKPTSWLWLRSGLLELEAGRLQAKLGVGAQSVAILRQSMEQRPD